MRLVRKYKNLIVFALLLSCAIAQGAENKNFGSFFSRAHNAREQACLRGTDNLRNVTIQYENDKACPRWDYANNKEAYIAIDEAVKNLISEDGNTRAIVIVGAASPVGNEDYNNRLALLRAEALRDVISAREGIGSLRIHVVSAGEDWATFNSYIEQNYQEPNREQVIAIIGSNVANDDKERQLQQLDNGKTWRILVRDFMATARNAAMIHIVEIYDLIPQSPSVLLQSVVAPIKPEVLSFANRPPVVHEPIEIIKSATTSVDKSKVEPQPQVAEQPQKQATIQKQEQTEEQPQEQAQPQKKSQQQVQTDALRKPVVAVRSNLLVPALNIGVEVPIGNQWSVGADYYFPWVWPKRDNKNCFEFLSWGIEGRYWFGKNRTDYNRLQGHSIGLYGYMGYYDFERNFHGHQGEFINIGLDYTYAMAVGKKKSVHFEFSLGVGYIYSQARKYTVIESGAPLISDKITKKIGFFGPTKANISLVVPIFQKVKPNDKQRGNE